MCPLTFAKLYRRLQVQGTACHRPCVCVQIGLYIINNVHRRRYILPLFGKNEVNDNIEVFEIFVLKFQLTQLYTN